jgi:hypothetical protein
MPCDLKSTFHERTLEHTPASEVQRLKTHPRGRLTIGEITIRATDVAKWGRLQNKQLQSWCCGINASARHCGHRVRTTDSTTVQPFSPSASHAGPLGRLLACARRLSRRGPIVPACLRSARFAAGSLVHRLPKHKQQQRQERQERQRPILGGCYRGHGTWFALPDVSCSIYDRNVNLPGYV